MPELRHMPSMDNAHWHSHSLERDAEEPRWWPPGAEHVEYDESALTEFTLAEHTRTDHLPMIKRADQKLKDESAVDPNVNKITMFFQGPQKGQRRSKTAKIRRAEEQRIRRGKGGGKPTVPETMTHSPQPQRRRDRDRHGGGDDSGLGLRPTPKVRGRHGGGDDSGDRRQAAQSLGGIGARSRARRETEAQDNRVRQPMRDDADDRIRPIIGARGDRDRSVARRRRRDSREATSDPAVPLTQRDIQHLIDESVAARIQQQRSRSRSRERRRASPPQRAAHPVYNAYGRRRVASPEPSYDHSQWDRTSRRRPRTPPPADRRAAGCGRRGQRRRACAACGSGC